MRKRAILMLLAVMSALLVTTSSIAVARTINGDNRANILRGTDRSDTIKGRGGSDKIYGKKGNDDLFGGRGGDKVYGGPGYDEILGGPGRDILRSGDGWDWLEGGPGPDKLFGEGGGAAMTGGGGNDELYAGTGLPAHAPDGANLVGDEGDDTYYAGPDNDQMVDWSSTSGDTYIMGRDFGHDLVEDLGGNDLLDLTSYSRSDVVSQTSVNVDGKWWVDDWRIQLNDGSVVDIIDYSGSGLVNIRFG